VQCVRGVRCVRRVWCMRVRCVRCVRYVWCVRCVQIAGGVGDQCRVGCLSYIYIYICRSYFLSFSYTQRLLSSVAATQCHEQSQLATSMSVSAHSLPCSGTQSALLVLMVFLIRVRISQKASITRSNTKFVPISIPSLDEDVVARTSSRRLLRGRT
jgi:hypothetical protein